MAEETVFLSYSRQQFYFAESLALRLQQANIPVWFDVQRLKPGSDWSADIQRGLKDSSRVALILSQAALVSPHVQSEWQAALQADKPVILVLFEAVELPPELTGFPVIDFRGSFEKGARKLIDALQTGAVYRDRVPRPNLLKLPLRLPRDVWLVALALLIPGILMLAMIAGALRDWIYIYPDGRIETVLPPAALALFVVSYGGLAGWFLYQGWAFLRRRASYYALRFPMPLAPFAAAVVYVFWHLVTQDSLKIPLLLPSQVFGVIAALIGLLNLFVFFRTTTRSEDVLRWLPTGEAHYSLRSMGRAVSFTRSEPGKSPSAPVRYRLFYDPADERVAARVRAALSEHQEHPSSGSETPDVDLLILSSRTPRELIERVLHDGNRLISIVASRIALPDDDRRLMRYQWIDFRARSDDQLAALSRFLSARDPETVPTELNALPESLTKPVAPPRITLLSSIIRFLAAFLGALLALNLAAANLIPAQIDQWFLLASSVAIIVIAALFVWLSGAIIDRQITFRNFVRLFVAYIIVGLLLRLLDSQSIIVDIAATAIWAGLVRLFFFDALRDWLPETGGAAPLTPRGLLRGNAFNATMTTLALVAMFVSAILLLRSPVKILSPRVGFEGKIAFASQMDGSSEIYVIEGSSTTPRRLTERSARDWNPVWSPDGKQIAFLSAANNTDWHAYVMDADGSNVRQLTTTGILWGDLPAWSPDGKQIAFAQAQGYDAELYVADADGSNLHRLTENDRRDWNPVWSPDGKRIAYFSSRDLKDAIWIMNADGSDQRQLIEPNTGAHTSLTWSPDGRFIGSVVGNHFEIVTADGANRRIIEEVGTRYLSWSPDGTRLLVYGDDSEYQYHIFTAEADGSSLRSIFQQSGLRYDTRPVWSPDSQFIAFTLNDDLFVISREGGEPTRLTNNRAGNVDPVWAR